MVGMASKYDSVVVIVGNNDFEDREEVIIPNLVEFQKSVGVEKLYVVGLLTRMDHSGSSVSKFNLMLRGKFKNYFGPDNIRQKTFLENDQAHLDPEGPGFKDLSQLIFKICTILKKLHSSKKSKLELK